MSLRSGPVTLLGPQSRGPTLREVAEGLPSGPIATIRAGWQEWESDDAALSEALDGRAVNLRLHERAERVWLRDPELTEAHHRMQHHVRTLRHAYNLRLSHLFDAWVELADLPGPPELLEPELEAALRSIRDLDERQQTRVGEIRAEFADRFDFGERTAVARERAQIAELIADSAAVVVDGGHVAVLLNRLRIFDIKALIEGRTLIGISGGAMVLSDRLILFHDSPPWGPGHAEVAESGLGLAPDIVALPHARHRLRLDDPGRVGRLVRRLAPADCVLLEQGTRAAWDGSEWSVGAARRLAPSGEVLGGSAA